MKQPIERNWVVVTKRFGRDKAGDLWTVDKREYTQLSEGEMQVKVRELNNQMKVDGYWSDIRAFQEKKSA
jgi:hypothetical protein